MSDMAAMRSWLGILHGDAPGLIHICATGLWTGATFPTNQLDAAAAYAATLDSSGREGVYARVTTLKEPLKTGQRGGAADTFALSALWADIDLAGPGHKTDQKLPPDQAAAAKVLTVARLPDPTLWVHSGGGLYPIWLLDRPHLIADDLADVADLAANWQKAIGHASASLGWHYGTGVGDLARVLRIPGTTNRKAGLKRACRVVDGDRIRYTLEALYQHIADALSAIPEPEPAPRLQAVRVDDGSISPGDDYAAKTDWADILQPAGWRYAYTRGQTRYWRRPGKDTAGISATTNALGTDRLHVFTTSTEFEVGSHSKLGAHAILNHGGDLKAAAKALQKNGYGKPPPLSADSAEQRAVIAELTGSSFPTDNEDTSPTVLRAIDGTAVRVIAEPKPAPEKFGTTEDGMALAVVAHHNHEMRYCPQRGAWLVWNGHVWAWDDGETHREKIRALARDLPETEGWRAFKRRAMSAAGVAAIARLAQSDARVVTHLSALDSNPFELNTPAGIIDLHTGQTRPPDPAALHTRTTRIAPDASADTTMWQLFLSQTFNNNAELVAYLQRLVGYSAVGRIGPHVLPFAHGSGGNGKGAFLEAVAGVLGDYATTAPVDFLMQQPYTSHETEIARLAGTRMVLCSEVSEGDRFDEAKVKQLTGGDTLTARFMRQDHFSFQPTHQLWLLGNHKPEVRSGGRAFWRRLRLIPFLHEVPEDKIIEDLQGILIREHGPSLLAWIVAGAVDYLNGGLREPNSVKAATAEYAKDQDTVARFVEDCCHLGGGENVKVRAAKVREAYERWCVVEGETAVTPKAFGLALKNRFGVDLARGAKGARFYGGLTLLADAEAAPDGDEPPSERERYP